METTLTVVLRLKCSKATDASYVVGEVLDAGVFQDAINEYEHDGKPVTVLSAIVTS
jgi:hypothetical protein